MATAGDRLGTLQARANTLRDHLASLWTRVDSGGDVETSEITTTEAELSVVDRQLPSVQRLAAAELLAAQSATWAEVEADTLKQHRVYAATFHDQLAVAQTAMTNVLDSAHALNKHLAAFRRDNRRPAPPFGQYTGGDPIVNGERLIPANIGATVLGLTADALSHPAARDQGLDPIRAEYRQMRNNTPMPSDPRKESTA